MARPLMQHGIGHLETMFATQIGDTKLLKQLEHELSYRQVPRANALAEKVAMALRTGEPAKASAPSPKAEKPLAEDDLFTNAPGPAVPVYLPRKVVEALPASPAQALTTSGGEPALAVSVEDAYRLLNVTATTSWEQVEQSRRRLVEEAHPANISKLSLEKQAQAASDARRVNAAYLVLAAKRVG